MFGEIFISLLKQKNCTAADVARGTGISNGLLGDYKRNRSKPSQENLNKLANFFGVSVDYLLGRDPGIEKAPLPEVDPETGLDEERRALLAIYDSLSEEKRAMMLETAQAFRAKEEAERKTGH